MKTILTTTFAIAVMAFAFNATPAEAWTKYDQCRATGGSVDDCRQYAEGDLHDLDREENESESEVADSGNEGPTSAAQESDQ